MRATNITTLIREKNKAFGTVYGVEGSQTNTHIHLLALKFVSQTKNCRYGIMNLHKSSKR